MILWRYTYGQCWLKIAIPDTRSADTQYPVSISPYSVNLYLINFYGPDSVPLILSYLMSYPVPANQ